MFNQDCRNWIVSDHRTFDESWLWTFEPISSEYFGPIGGQFNEPITCLMFFFIPAKTSRMFPGRYCSVFFQFCIDTLIKVVELWIAASSSVCHQNLAHNFTPYVLYITFLVRETRMADVEDQEHPAPQSNPLTRLKGTRKGHRGSMTKLLNKAENIIASFNDEDDKTGALDSLITIHVNS